VKPWLLLLLLCMAAAAPRSGYDDAIPETRVMQDNDGAKLGFLWVREGEAQWSLPVGPEGKSCASCHGDAAVSMCGRSAYVGLQSRGMPMHVNATGPFVEAGRTLFNARMGQLNLSCAQCHEQRAGGKLAGGIIPQGHQNAYPEYWLEWQTMAR
jgi:sulfur-oxidizing protein SoxA